MNMHDLASGIQILAKYDTGEGGECSASHDELHLSGPPPETMHADDVAKLASLYFRWDPQFDGWAVFT